MPGELLRSTMRKWHSFLPKKSIDRFAKSSIVNDLLLKYHPAAQAEILAAVEWYAEKSDEVVLKFDEQLLHAEQQVVAHPDAWGLYLHGTR